MVLSYLPPSLWQCWKDMINSLGLSLNFHSRQRKWLWASILYSSVYKCMHGYVYKCRCIHTVHVQPPSHNNAFAWRLMTSLFLNGATWKLVKIYEINNWFSRVDFNKWFLSNWVPCEVTVQCRHVSLTTTSVQVHTIAGTNFSELWIMYIWWVPILVIFIFAIR